MTLKDYYENTNNLNLITEGLNARETVFLNFEGKIIRGIKANHSTYLKKNIDHYRLTDHKYNIYRSIAKFKDLPMFSWNRETRFKQYDVWTNKEVYKKHIIGYDYYIDFDNNDDDDAFVRTEVSDTSKYLLKMGVKHTIYSSGKGYHIKAKPLQETPEYCKATTEKLIKLLGLITPDLSIYRWQGIIKAPYSVDCKTMNVCTPIKPDMFQDFKKNETRID